MATSNNRRRSRRGIGVRGAQAQQGPRSSAGRITRGRAGTRSSSARERRTADLNRHVSGGLGTNAPRRGTPPAAPAAPRPAAAAPTPTRPASRPAASAPARSSGKTSGTSKTAKTSKPAKQSKPAKPPAQTTRGPLKDGDKYAKRLENISEQLRQLKEMRVRSAARRLPSPPKKQAKKAPRRSGRFK